MYITSHNMEEPEKPANLLLTLIQNRGFVFNVDDYMTIRTKHRVVGNLIGCTVNNPRSTAIGGLPAVFSPIEVKFLLEKGIVAVRKCPERKSGPSEEIVQQYGEFSKNQLEEQKEILRRKKIRELEGNLTKIVAGKQRKLAKLGTNEELDGQKVLEEEIGKIPELQRGNLLIQTPTEYPFVRNEDTLDELPVLSSKDQLKYRIYCNLWSRGYFLTSGSTFGGDFLIYPSDPMLVHASHVVHVLNANSMDTKKFIASNRLCVGVGKSCIIAFEETPGKITYITSQWQGNFKPD